MKNLRTNPRCAAAIGALLLAVPIAGRAQSSAPPKAAAPPAKKGAAASPRVSLSPRFVPGQTFRYEMEFETTTNTRRTGFTSDPEGPSSLVVSWNATVRIEILPADEGTKGGVRLRTSYEKSAATVRSDTFDPVAAQTQEQFHSLEGKVIEFTLDAGGKVKYVAGLEGIVDSEKAAQSAREWIGQLSASAGAPPGGVAVGQSWSSEQPADSLPLAGRVWRTDSQYLRNEPCHPPNPDVPADAAAADAGNSPSDSQQASDCAVILANLSLARSKTAGRDQTPEDFRKNGVQSSGKWEGAAQSLVYVSLDTGMVVSATQSGSQQMDVTMTSNHENTSMRHSGSIASRSQVSLLAGDSQGREPAGSR